MPNTIITQAGALMEYPDELQEASWEGGMLVIPTTINSITNCL